MNAEKQFPKNKAVDKPIFGESNIRVHSVNTIHQLKKSDSKTPLEKKNNLRMDQPVFIEYYY